MLDKINKLNIWADLLIPKLEAVSNSGNGATIHTANGYLCRSRTY
mgnify:CR=1 FL=1